MKYSELNLDPRLNTAIEKLNYVEATAIQEQTIPHILASKDVAGLAQTGTGKTAAFLIPLIERILRTQNEPTHERAFKDWHARSFILILVPTRELAEQINDNVIKLTDGCGLKSFPLYGGTGYEKQKEALQSGLSFVVSTPGRLIDLYKENHVDLKQVKAVVFDEADRMFDMGFKDDMKYILSRIPRERQFLVFSATLNFDVLNTAYQFGAEPVEINISRDQAKAENVKDYIMHIGHEEKPQNLLSILKKENPKQAMIFTNFKHNVDRISAFLMDNQIPAMGISSLMSQAQRNNVIEKFKADNDQNILVATDVAARGLDINGVDLVVNFEMPQDAESYVHRIGRTGRAGREGKAYSLICDRDIDSLSRVEEYTKKKIETVFLEDEELIKEFTPFRKEEGSLRNRFDRTQKGGGRGGPRQDRDARGGDRQDRRPKGGKRFDGPRHEAPAGASAARGPVEGAPRGHRHKGRDQKDFRGRQQKDQGGTAPQHQNRPLKPASATANTASANAAAQNRIKLPNKGRNFRNNAPTKRQPVAQASFSQKVKSFFQKIFG